MFRVPLLRLLSAHVDTGCTIHMERLDDISLHSRSEVIVVDFTYYQPQFARLRGLHPRSRMMTTGLYSEDSAGPMSRDPDPITLAAGPFQSNFERDRAL